MAAVSTLLKWNRPFSYMQQRHDRSVLVCSKYRLRLNYVRLQITCNYKQSTCSDAIVKSDSTRVQIRENSFDQIAVQIKRALDSLKKPATAAVLLGLFWFYDPNRALAASDGRVGCSGGFMIICGFFLVVFIATLVIGIQALSEHAIRIEGQNTSILKLQVGLLVSGKTLQQDFNRLAQSADTSTSEGLRNVLTEATLALLRNRNYYISSYSSVDVKRSIEEEEEHFSHLSIEERGKFYGEPLVNMNSIKKQSSKIHNTRGFSNDYTVVTILVVAEGTLKLKPIKTSADLKVALQKLGSTRRNKIKAVEVMWNYVSEKELLVDYPFLSPLS